MSNSIHLRTLSQYVVADHIMQFKCLFVLAVCEAILSYKKNNGIVLHTWMLHPFARIWQLQPARLKMVAKILNNWVITISLMMKIVFRFVCYSFTEIVSEITVLLNQSLIRLIQLVLFCRGRSIGIVLEQGLRGNCTAFTASKIT